MRHTVTAYRSVQSRCCNKGDRVEFIIHARVCRSLIATHSMQESTQAATPSQGAGNHCRPHHRRQRGLQHQLASAGIPTCKLRPPTLQLPPAGPRAGRAAPPAYPANNGTRATNRASRFATSAKIKRPIGSTTDGSANARRRRLLRESPPPRPGAVATQCHAAATLRGARAAPERRSIYSLQSPDKVLLHEIRGPVVPHILACPPLFGTGPCDRRNLERHRTAFRLR